VPIGKPFFEFAAAAQTTDLLNFPHRFDRAIDIVDEKTCVSFNNNFRDRTRGVKFRSGLVEKTRSLAGDQSQLFFPSLRS